MGGGGSVEHVCLCMDSNISVIVYCTYQQLVYLHGLQCPELKPK